jgi:DNA-binding PadR family transcriptional regulator
VKPREYYVMLALSDSARHGLAIAREVEQLSSGDVHLWPASLYGTLDELTRRGWLESRAAPMDESEKKRFYSLTRSGRSALREETDRLAALVKTARTRIRRAGEAS